MKSKFEKELDRWFPLARSEEVDGGHIVQSALFGQELAIWRDDAGAINVWENRCPHRGVRLSIGTNQGSDLKCRYHCWSFASGSGQCVSLPNSPNRPIPEVVKATVHQCSEKYGYVWGRLRFGEDQPNLDQMEGERFTSLRSVFTAANSEAIATALPCYAFGPSEALHEQSQNVELEQLTEFCYAAKTQSDTVILMLQPLDDSSTLIHAAIKRVIKEGDRLPTLRHHNKCLALVRDRAESLQIPIGKAFND